MMFLKSPAEIELMRHSAQFVSEILVVLADAARPGASTGSLEEIALREIQKRGATSAYKNFRAFEEDPAFPSAICTSVNGQVMNGIPSSAVILRSGDIVTINLGLFYQEFAGDGGITVAVGDVQPSVRKLLQVTEQSLWEGINRMNVSGRLGDVGAAIQHHVENSGFSIVRNQFGHGIGRALHEEPPVPNYGRPGTGMKLLPGLVLAVKPIVNQGGSDTYVMDNGWTIATTDGQPSCCFSHTIAITERGPDVLTKLGAPAKPASDGQDPKTTSK
jgi:methionyl aminopeptidase